jgi:hypothetical protein
MFVEMGEFRHGAIPAVKMQSQDKVLRPLLPDAPKPAMQIDKPVKAATMPG